MEPAGTFPVLDRTYPYLMKIEEPQPEQPNQATHGYKPKSLLAQAGWLMIARVTGFAFTFLIPIVLSRVLDLKQFGLYKQAFLVVATSQSILPLGFGMSTFYFLSREHDRDKRASIAGNALLFHVFVATLAAATVFFWPGILVLIFGSADLVRYSSQIAGLLLLWISSYLIESIATANQDVMYSTVFIITAQLTKSIAMLTAALWTRSVEGVLYAGMLQGAVQTTVLLWYLQRRFAGYWRHFSLPMLRFQLSYTLPLGLAGLIYTLQNDAHNYFVSSAFGAAAFAIYSVGVAQLPLIGVMRESINAVLLGRVSYLQQEGRRKEILRLSIQVMRKLALVYWPLYALLMVVANEFVLVLYTKRFVSSVPLLRMNLTLLPFMVIVQDPILRAFAEHRYYLLALRAVLVSILFTVLTTSLERIGLLGAVSLVVAISLAERIAIILKTTRVLGFGREDARELARLGSIAAISGVAAAAAFGVRWLMIAQKPLIVLAVTAMAFWTVYAALLWRTGSLQPDERELANRYWNRALSLLPGR